MSKVCKTCGEEKDETEFYLHSKNKQVLRTSCKQCHSNKTTDYYHRTKEDLKENSREYSLKKKYGLSIKQYNEMLLSQNGLCLICEEHQALKEYPLVVDHNHKTNKIRGLLCIECNTGLGMFKDSPVILGKAIKYLTEN